MQTRFSHQNRTKSSVFFILACIALAVSFSYFNIGQKFEGEARVIDGDSLRLGEKDIRIYGIDAPEATQTCTRDGREVRCGREAARHLAKLIDGKAVKCEEKDVDRYQRSVSRCFVGELDLGAQMVRDGYAIAYGSYKAEEAEARRDKRVLWAGEFERPQSYRERKRVN